MTLAVKTLKPEKRKIRTKVCEFLQDWYNLTLKAPITTAADGIHKYFSLFYREKKT